MEAQELFVIVLLAGMASGVFIIVMAMRKRAHTVELRHRERMAMIERGMVPPPESSWRDGSWEPQQVMARAEVIKRAVARRWMTAGIIVVALGLSFMTIIGVAAGEPGVAVGLGGAFAILGVALIVISFVIRQNFAASMPGPAQGLAVPPPAPEFPAAPPRDPSM